MRNSLTTDSLNIVDYSERSKNFGTVGSSAAQQMEQTQSLQPWIPDISDRARNAPRRQQS